MLREKKINFQDSVFAEIRFTSRPVHLRNLY